MHGLPTIGTIGFGWFEVSGRSRVPSPPAMTTAFTPPPRACALTTYCAAAASASPSANQNSQSGHSVDVAGDVRIPTER